MSKGPYKRMVKAIPVGRCSAHRSFSFGSVLVVLPLIEDGWAMDYDGIGGARVRR